MQQDTRWLQRFFNYRKAVAKLSDVVEKKAVGELSELEKEGLIQRFEYTYELAWNTLQDLLRDKGYTDIAGPTPTLQQAFKDGYITDGRGWQALKKSRQLTSHTYNEDTANEIAQQVYVSYYALFTELENTLTAEAQAGNTAAF